MKTLRWLVLAWLLSAAPLAACPACKNANPTQRAGEGILVQDPKAAARGFNISIYLLLSMVYGIPTVMGLSLWRISSGHRARRRQDRARAVDPSAVQLTIPVREEAGS
jgi:hypothetical protein